MKLIIAGGRTYQFTRADKKALDEIHARETVAEVVSGCAAGADLEGQAWAATKERHPRGVSDDPRPRMEKACERLSEPPEPERARAFWCLPPAPFFGFLY